MKIIDIHTHGLGGYDTSTTNPDDILKIAESTWCAWRHRHYPHYLSGAYQDNEKAHGRSKGSDGKATKLAISRSALNGN